MKILVCNDDGIDAPGLRLLADAARTLSDNVWVVAPDHKWSAASHQISFDRDLTLTAAGAQRYACSGAPADCVVAAMTVLFAVQAKPDLVLSGVNDKRNVAEDAAYSGTMAIAREATFWEVPAIAISRAVPANDATSDRPALARLVDTLWQARAQWAMPRHWLALNLPAALPAPIAQARIGRGDKIGGASEIVSRTADRIVYRITRGRPATHVPGDESSAVDAGCIALVRHRWDADVPLSDAVVAGWSAASTQR